MRIQAILLDQPAKAAFINIIQYNGRYNCISCFHPGEYSAEFKKQIYKPRSDNLLYKNKTSEDYETNIKELEKRRMANGETNNRDLKGMKGRTPLSKILVVPDQVPQDYMHLCCQGHGKLMLNWLISNKRNPYSLSKIKFQIIKSLHNVY
jgi:hypothetical protein